MATREKPAVWYRSQRCVTLLCLGLIYLFAGLIVWHVRQSFATITGVESKLAHLVIEENRLARAVLLHVEADSRAERQRQSWINVLDETSARLTDILSRRPARRPIDSALWKASAELTADDSDFWSFERLRSVAPPAADPSAWGHNPIDTFILTLLQKAELQPNAEASRAVLARRLWFDLTGLPPQPDQLQAFLADDYPLAYQQLVDRLLAEPSFGERWARVWLDLARYADSNGFEEDELRPHAYAYRDFVIWAMNEDLPFDQFIQWQIAGDELQSENPLAVAATGFLTAGPVNTFIPQEIERRDELDDIVSTMGSAMLGLTIGCARCHDHRYDPIPTRDYYGLVAIFESSERKHRYLVPDEGREYRRWADPVNQSREEIRQMLLASALEDNIAALDFTDEEKDLLRQPIDPANERQALLISWCKRCLRVNDSFIDEDSEPLPEDRQRYQELQEKIARLEPTLPERPPQGLTLVGSDVCQTFILDRGKLELQGDSVGPGFLTVLTPGQPSWEVESWQQWAPNQGDQPAQPRSALATWLTDIEQGGGSLLARVIVNRLWQHHFGRGLVDTPSDFGLQGSEPTHPELLEWLAGELVDNGWSLKHIHRLIVTSATYRQSNTATARQLEIDPENKLWSRRQTRRLTAEMIRDTMLAVGNRLNRKMYGPGVFPPIPEEAVYNKEDDPKLIWPIDAVDRPAVRRRSIYVMHKRTTPVPLLTLFDAPSAGFSCGKRNQTTVPTQALSLWNSSFVREQAKGLASCLSDPEGRLPDEPASIEQAIDELYLVTLSRRPQRDELRDATSYLQQPGDTEGPRSKWIDLCHVLLMNNEFHFVD